MAILVQRYSRDMADQATQTVTLDTAVDTSKSFLIVASRSGSALDAEEWGVAAAFTTLGSSVSSVTLSRAGTGTGVTAELQVITHDSLSVQHGSVTITATNATADVTISAVTLAETFPVISMGDGSADQTKTNDYFVRATFTSTTNLRLTRAATSTGVIVKWQVVSWSGASVEHDTITLTDPASGTAAVSSTTLAEAFLSGSFTISDSRLDCLPRWKFDSTTQISATRIGTTGTTVIELYTVRPADITSQQFSITDIGAPTNTTITTVADTSKTFTLLSQSATGTGSAWDRGVATSLLTSTTNVASQIGDTGNTNAGELQVIEMEEAAGGVVIPVFMHHYRQQGIS